MIRLLLVASVLLAPAVPPAAAESMNFKLLTNYSQASFRSDAPLETFVGTSALESIQGTLTLDPAKPQDAKGLVKVDMNRVTTGVWNRDCAFGTHRASCTAWTGTPARPSERMTLSWPWA